MDSGDVGGLSKLLLQEGETLVGARGYMDPVYRDGYFGGASLLHHVAANPTRTRLPPNHLDVVGALLAAGADPNAANLEGYTVLELATNSAQLRRQNFKIDVLQALIDGGADPNHGGRTLERVFSSRDTSVVAFFCSVGFKPDLRFAAALGAMDQIQGFSTATAICCRTRLLSIP